MREERYHTQILNADTSVIAQAAQLLRDGELVAFPTETVYGLGADARSAYAVAKIYQVKGRPAHNPLIAHIHDLSLLPSVVSHSWLESSFGLIKQLEHFIPGPLSLVLPRNPAITANAVADLPTIAVRVPSHPIAQSLLRACNFPVVAPSANPSNYVSPTSAAHVFEQLAGRIPLIIDGGECSVGIESTILDISGPSPVCLREGAISREQLALALQCDPDILCSKVEASVRAPGMLRRHYAPRTRLRLFLNAPAPPIVERSGVICLSADSKLMNDPRFAHHAALSAQGDLSEVARNLFKLIRAFDSLGLAQIYVERCEEKGIGRAILDRLTRASESSGGE